MKAIDSYDTFKEKNRDLEVLISIIQAVHKSSSLEEIYRVALDSVVELENVDMAMVYLVDEEKREAVLQAHRNLPEDYVRRAGRIPRPKGVTWKVINTREIWNLKDIQKDLDIGPAGKDLGHHGALGIPIFLEEKAIGLIWFVSYKEHRFNEDEVSLLSSLGDQIAIAIARAKQTEELKDRNMNLSILSEISQVIHQSVDLKQVYKVVLDVTKDLKFVDLMSVYLAEGEGDKREAILQTHNGSTEGYLKIASRIPYSKGVTWEVINSGKFNYYENAADPSNSVEEKALGQRALLSIPVRSANETIGVIHFSSFEKNSFTEEELNFLLSLGNQIGIAIAKTKAFEEIKRWKDTLQEGEQRYHALVEHTYDLICETSFEGRFLYVSPKHKDLLGYEPGELIGTSIFEHIHPDDLPATRTEFMRAITTFSSGHAVFRYKHKNGGWRWLESTGRPFQTAAGEIRGAIASRDITEYKRIGEEILRVHRRESGGSKKSEKIPVSLMVASFSTLLREGIRKMLESERDIKIAAETPTYSEIINLVEQKKPDVLFIDSALPKLDITEIQESIKERRMETKIVLLLHTLDEEVIINAISLGCSGILTDISDIAQFTKAIKTVNQEEIWAERKIITKVLKRLLPLRRNKLRFLKSILTKREEEIIELVAQGYSNKHISNKLFISENTLKAHLANIFKKLGISNRHQLFFSLTAEGIPANKTNPD